LILRGVKLIPGSQWPVQVEQGQEGSLGLQPHKTGFNRMSEPQPQREQVCVGARGINLTPRRINRRI